MNWGHTARNTESLQLILDFCQTRQAVRQPHPLRQLSGTLCQQFSGTIAVGEAVNERFGNLIGEGLVQLALDGSSDSVDVAL